MMKSPFLLVIIALVLVAAFHCCDKPREEKKIILDEVKKTALVKPLKHILFVGKWYGKNGIYKYDMVKKKYETLWWHPRENVILLVTKPGDNPAFFLTGGKMGIKGNFPFFERIKIYVVNADLSAIENIYKIEGGLQITARWNQDSNLEVVFTAIDKSISSYVNKYTKTFDNYGRLIDDEIETFDIIKDGFPELLPKRNPTVSSSGRYGLSVLGDSVFLKTAERDSSILIITTRHKLNKISWSSDENFLFLSSLDLKNETVKTGNPQSSELFIYSIARDSVIAYWDGGGIKNFFTFDSLIVFDNGFGKNSLINVFNFVKGELITEFRTKSECGLFYIPRF